MVLLQLGLLMHYPRVWGVTSLSVMLLLTVFPPLFFLFALYPPHFYIQSFTSNPRVSSFQLLIVCRNRPTSLLWLCASRRSGMVLERTLERALQKEHWREQQKESTRENTGKNNRKRALVRTIARAPETVQEQTDQPTAAEWLQESWHATGENTGESTNKGALVRALEREHQREHQNEHQRGIDRPANCGYRRAAWQTGADVTLTDQGKLLQPKSTALCHKLSSINSRELCLTPV